MLKMCLTYLTKRSLSKELIFIHVWVFSTFLVLSIPRVLVLQCIVFWKTKVSNANVLCNGIPSACLVMLTFVQKTCSTEPTSQSA